MNCQASILEGVNELNGATFPSLKRRGGCAVQKISRSHLSPRRPGGRSAKVYRPEDFAGLTTPSAALRWLRIFLLMPQPPLLFKEGHVALDFNSFTTSMTAHARSV